MVLLENHFNINITNSLESYYLLLIFYADNFHKVLSSTLVHQQVNFNFESTFVKQYFGSDHSHELSYEEFVQLLQVHMYLHIKRLYFISIHVCICYVYRVYPLSMPGRHLYHVIQKGRALLLHWILSR